jgi:UDPglucose 6-dehydrogenase
VSGKRIAVLGFAFKADTNDTRESPAIRICQDLLEEGAQLAIVDPKVEPAQIAADLGCSEANLNPDHAYRDAANAERHWVFCSSAQDACDGADAVVVLTEWEQFSQLNWCELASQMRRPAWVFDTRGVVNIQAVQAAGLRLWRLGVASPLTSHSHVHRLPESPPVQ